VENSLTRGITEDGDTDKLTTVVFWMKVCKTSSERKDEDDHWRELTLRILLEYGVKSHLLYTDVYNPLMATIPSLNYHQERILNIFLDERFSVLDTLVRKETVYHVYIMAHDPSTLEKLLPLGDRNLVSMADLHGQTPLNLRQHVVRWQVT